MPRRSVLEWMLSEIGRFVLKDLNGERSRLAEMECVIDHELKDFVTLYHMNNVAAMLV